MSNSVQPFLLSRQELNVIVLSMEGLGDKEVADAMGLSLGTVRTYWKRITAKVGGRTRAETVATFVRAEARREIERERSLVVRLQQELERLREAEGRFRAICDCSPIGIYLCDVNGGCLYVNLAWERITGLPAHATLGGTWKEIVHVSDRDRFLGWWQIQRKSDAPKAMEFRFQTPKGLLWIRTILGPMFIEGELKGYVGTIEDVSARRLVARSTDLETAAR